ncbi:methylene-fatty-acyl-phospholipid synthase [Coprinopsis marcescibilis]|uniref:Phosphatidyl-N-methylethanolamine N-methyltransferase n=1 Tax=Coprinopsis marcescibilis TaxID=230819 RepID=A0A5C3L2N4_COPMA|nr:methylene-fatty-acyl-phospholipid synthase [Coprinopsis marcescibilis]
MSLDFATLLDLSKSSLLLSLFAITFNPTAWNIVARNEYRNKTITKLFGGNTRYGCYFLAVLIFSFGLLRDALFHNALSEQPRIALIPYEYASKIAIVLGGLGQLFVISSTWQLGVTGTFLGDYFGILMDKRVEGFPFNVLNDPMYVGSTLSFIATSLWLERPAGLFVSVYVYVVYLIALRFEGPFTTMIYTKRAEQRKKNAAKST